MKKGIIFDLDDTLCDYNGAKEKAIKKITKKLEDNGIISEEFWNIYREKEPILFRQFIEQKITITDYRRRRYKDILVDVGYFEDLDNFADELNEMYIKITNDEVELFKDAIETLDYLKKKGYTLAIFTNGPLDGQTKKIEKFDLQNKVDRVYYSAKIGMGKPAREAFEFVINDLSIKPRQLVMIGDSIRDDYNGATNMNIQAILIERKAENWEKEFQGIRVHSLRETLNIIERL